MQNLVHRIHYAWWGLAGLWLLAFCAATVNVLAEPQPQRFVAAPSHAATTFFAMAFTAYLVGGFVLGKIHNRHTARFVNASYTAGQRDGMTVFHVEPAGRHLPFWLIGLFGAFFLFSMPYMLAGSGIGAFFTVLLAAVLWVLGLQPKLWRPVPPHEFAMDASTLRAEGRTVPLAEVRSFLIGTSLPGRASGGTAGTGDAASTQTIHVVGGNPIAAHGMMAAQQLTAGTSAAAGQGIAEVANRYFREMRARSWRIEALAGGANLILARGLDAHTAEALLKEVQQLSTKPGPADA